MDEEKSSENGATAAQVEVEENVLCSDCSDSLDSAEYAFCLECRDTFALDQVHKISKAIIQRFVEEGVDSDAIMIVLDVLHAYSIGDSEGIG